MLSRRSITTSAAWRPRCSRTSVPPTPIRPRTRCRRRCSSRTSRTSQITWALVTLATRACSTAMELYRLGTSPRSEARRRSGFDPSRSPNSCRSINWPACARPERVGSPAHRAHPLAQRRAEVHRRAHQARQRSGHRSRARGGLRARQDRGRQGRGPLLEALTKADKDNRRSFSRLFATHRGEGLVIASAASRATRPRHLAQNKQLFDMLRKIADRAPRRRSCSTRARSPSSTGTEAGSGSRRSEDLPRVPFLATG